MEIKEITSTRFDSHTVRQAFELSADSNEDSAVLEDISDGCKKREVAFPVDEIITDDGLIIGLIVHGDGKDSTKAWLSSMVAVGEVMPGVPSSDSTTPPNKPMPGESLSSGEIQKVESTPESGMAGATTRNPDKPLQSSVDPNEAAPSGSISDT